MSGRMIATLTTLGIILAIVAEIAALQAEGTHLAPTQVTDAYANHLGELSAGNVTALVSQYERNATIDWTGVRGAPTIGKVSGSINIGIALTSFLGTEHLKNFSLSNEHQAIGVNGNA
jgi:hypothetical protein